MEAVPVIARGKLRALRKPRSVGPHDTDGFVCQSVATALDSFALIVFPGRAVHAPEIVRDAADTRSGGESGCAYISPAVISRRCLNSTGIFVISPIALQKCELNGECAQHDRRAEGHHEVENMDAVYVGLSPPLKLSPFLRRPWCRHVYEWSPWHLRLSLNCFMFLQVTNEDKLFICPRLLD